MNNEFDDKTKRTDIQRGRSRARQNTRTGSESAENGRRTRHSSRSYEYSESYKPRSASSKSRMGSASSRSAANTAKSKRIRRIVITMLLECVTLFLIFGYAHFARQWNKIQRQPFQVKNVENQELTTEKKQQMTGYWTIAVFGVDSRDGNVGKGTNADVIMICNVNRANGEIKLVSVYRDAYLNVSDSNNYNKINAAYAQGGPEQAVKALNKNLDLNITNYVTFNWKAVADAINILGGVDVELSKAEFYYINSFITETVKKTGVGSYHLKSAGMNHLDGIQAVAYGRLRLMDTDYARTVRQRLIIEKAFEKAKKADYSVLNNILVVVMPQIATNISFQEFTDVALNVTSYHMGETSGFPSARGETRMGKKGDCVIPKTLESNVILLHKFLFDEDAYEPTDTVKKFSSKIAADSGMYKEGAAINNVSTGNGSVPKGTSSSDSSSSAYETSASSSTGETGESLPEESTTGGRPGWENRPTDEAGNPIPTTSGSGTSGSGATTPSKTQPSTGGSTTPSTQNGGPGVVTTAPSETASTTTAPQTSEVQSSTAPSTQSTTAAPTTSPGPQTTTTAASPGTESTTMAGPVAPTDNSNIIVAPGN